MDKLLKLSYKGSRNYLHGSDFFNTLMDIANELMGNSDSFVERLLFRGYARKACKLTDIKPNDTDVVIGQVRYMNPLDKSHVSLWLVETDKLITGKYPFDETIILSESELYEDKRSIVLPKRSIYSPIEDVIVLTKRLNNTISPLPSGNWLFGQLDLSEPLIDNYHTLEVQMTNLIERKFSVNDILIDGHKIGTIRFIMGVV